MTHTITNQYLASHNAGINLRQYAPRKADCHRDLHAAEGIIVGTMIGANVLLWGYVLARWLLA
jgi:hypothetical protein